MLTFTVDFSQKKNELQNVMGADIYSNFFSKKVDCNCKILQVQTFTVDFF